MRRLEARLIEDARALRARDPRGAVFMVVPSRLLGGRVRAGLARALGGVAGIHVMTLPDLAERIALVPLALEGRRPLPAVADRLLVDRAIQEAVPPEGGYFSGVLHARNFPAAVLGTLLDVKRAGLGPADLEAAFAESPKVRELAMMYRALESALRRHGYYDTSDLLLEAARLVQAEPERLGAAAVLAFGFVEMNPLEARLLDACGRAGPVLRYAAGADSADLPAAAGLSIIAAPGEEREVREIARAILVHVEQDGRLRRGRHSPSATRGVPARDPGRLRRGRHSLHSGDGAGGRGDTGRAQPASTGRGAPIGLRARGRDGVPGVRRSPATARNQSGRVGAALAPGGGRRRRP